MLTTEKITFDFANITMVRDQIVVVEYLNEEPINVEKGIKVLEAIKKLTNSRPVGLIHNTSDKYIYFTDAVRFMGSQLTENQHSYAVRAVVSTNPAARIAATNFINLYKPLIPTKIFGKLDEAIAWTEEVLSGLK